MTASSVQDSAPSIDVTPSLIAERYAVHGLLGSGGMGRVYRVHDEKLDEVVALKMLRRELVDDPIALERFRQEVKLARRVTSPHVVRTFDLGEHAGEYFLTMEYIEGRSLSQLIDQRRIPVAEVLSVARAACAGIAAAHAAGVMHRDLKPDNILVAKSGRIAITDFGIARTTDPDAAVEGFIGTPRAASTRRSRSSSSRIHSRQTIRASSRVSRRVSRAPSSWERMAGSYVRARWRTVRSSSPRHRAIAVGLSSLYAGRVPDAAMAFCRAVSCAPGMALAHAHLGAILLEAGALDESLSHLEAAAALDPLQPSTDLPRAYVFAGRWDEGLSLLAKAHALTHFARSQIGRFKLWRRELVPVNLEEALRDAPGDFPLWATLVAKFHRTGALPIDERDQYRSVVDVPDSRLRATRSQFFVEQLMYVGDHEAALTFIAVSVHAGLHDYLWIQRCPLLEPLRTDPRFEQLAATVRTRSEAVLGAVRTALASA